MKGFAGWKQVAANLQRIVDGKETELNGGQCDSLRAIAERLPQNGIIIADEVGMGKTRIATTLTKAVIEAGGRVAILVPPGLGFQWGDELHKSKVDGVKPILRSLWQYLEAWENKAPEKQSPWFAEDVLLISHAFCNWRLGANADAWRWALLPELYAHWIKITKGRYPRNYRVNTLLDDSWVKQAAASIANAVNAASTHPGRRYIDELVKQTPWPGSLDGREYAQNESLRPALEKAVGLGLGLFDLVVVDEAHKSRGQESGLNRLLKQVVLHSDDARRLAMTATPIELDVSQWQQILERIGVQDRNADAAITEYAAAVQKVRQLPNDTQVRKDFSDAAKSFQSSLGKYLLRRDKRESEAVRNFMQQSDGVTHSDYRRLQKIAVSTASLSPAWKQAVCAAEALSFVTGGLDDQTAKRLRLTLGNGHGIAALMDESLRAGIDSDDTHAESSNLEKASEKSKQKQRIEWWKDVMSGAFPRAEANVLYEHPAILAAVDAIEAVCDQGEKVLVFGRFTRPMQALVHLLNARELLRCVESEKHWPQKKVHDAEQGAIEVLLRDRGKGESLEQLNKWLGEQYGALEKQREGFRARLRKSLGQCLDAAFPETDRERALTALARPIQEILIDANPTDYEIMRAFIDVVSAASDQDQETSASDDESDKSEEILQRIEDEYGRTEGGFARLMNGGTRPHTRRLLQLAFNREHSHPKVLVAQSVVGREGLNLHEACRTVVLLHAEWNPGVVEQQIGRVDRINSLWEKRLAEAIEQNKPADELPRIEIRPILFEGTYDEHNWKVLMRRWDDLRAQLHGIVITPSIAEKLPGDLVKEINECAPNFSPKLEEG